MGATAQSISYSHRTTHFVGADGVIVIPEVEGKNHLWVIKPDEQVNLQVYDNQLDWQQEHILPLKLPKNSDITILPFENEYFFYNQSQAGSSKFLWHVDGKGNVADVSSKLRAIIKSCFTDTTVVCQLFSKGPRMFMLGNVYFPSLGKIITTLIQINLKLDQWQVKRFALDYDHRNEFLQRMLITPENKLLVLKERSSEEIAQVLHIIKVDLATSKTNAAVFTSNTRFSSPEILYNPVDSSTTVCGYRRSMLPRIFFLTLDDTLAQKFAPVTIRVPITEEMYGAFACVSTGTGGSTWLPVYGSWNALYQYNRFSSRVLVGLSSMVTLAGNKTVVMNASSYQPLIQAIHPYLQNVSPPGDVRFSVIDLQSRAIKDTVFKYYRRFFIEVSQYASFSRNNNGYLILKEKFRSNGKGIVLLNINKEGKLVSSPLRVYERYDYAIPQMRQTANGSLVFPYVYKNEVGLVKVTLEPDQ